MVAQKLFNAGYTDLVSVIPPDAPLSPYSSVRPESRGKVPGIPKVDGLWIGYDYVHGELLHPAQIDRSGANIGLKADRFPALDVDCDNPMLADRIVSEALKFLGPAPIRTSRPPRRLLVYAAEEPFRKIIATVVFGGKEYRVEMLGADNQYLIHGKHPSGAEYGWTGPKLWETKPKALSVVSAEKTLEFFAHLKAKLAGRAELIVQGTGAPSSDTAPPQEELACPDSLALAELVRSLPNDYPDRDTYIKIGHAIKASGGEDAFPVFHAWAAKWTGGTNDSATVLADWERMHPPYRVGWQYLQDLAAERTEYNVAQEEFASDPEQKEPEGKVSEAVNGTDWWVVERIVTRLAPKIRYVADADRFHVWGN